MKENAVRFVMNKLINNNKVIINEMTEQEIIRWGAQVQDSLLKKEDKDMLHKLSEMMKTFKTSWKASFSVVSEYDEHKMDEVRACMY
jgi:hypothetical protein